MLQLPRPLLLMGLLAVLLLAVAGCGGDDKGGGVASLGGADQPTTSPGGSSDPQRSALAHARCMRQHGINNLPDPQITAEGIIQQELPRGVRAPTTRGSARRSTPATSTAACRPPTVRSGVGVASEHAGDA